jgi:hypothetical protein
VVAYVVVDQFSGGPAGYVFRTSDFGQHWTDISGNLPNTPTTAIVLDSRTNSSMLAPKSGCTHQATAAPPERLFKQACPSFGSSIWS